MNWRAIASGIVDHLEQVPSPKWLGIVATFASVVLLLALIALSERHLRLRRKLTVQGLVPPGEAPAGWEDELSPVSLEGEGRAVVDNLLPRQPRPFLLTVAILALACWVVGFALAIDPYAFLTSREWQLQPLYLAAHFVTLRLFATMFTRNFLAGVVHLDMPAGDARRGISRVQGSVGALTAVLVALPFCLYDLQLLGSGKGGKGSTSEIGPGADQLLYLMWCIEWFLMAFIWVQLVGFLLLTRQALGDYRFRAPIEVVLLERHYRHFLAMSAHGASIVLGFFLVNVAYGWYTGAELSDYIGIVITLLLLVIGFIPPWMQLTHKMDRIVKGEMAGLRRRVASSSGAVSAAGAMPEAEAAGDIESRLDEALVMLRIAYLERLHSDLGNMEAWSIVMKVGVPLMTVAYYAVHIFRTAA